MQTVVVDGNSVDTRTSPTFGTAGLFVHSEIQNTDKAEAEARLVLAYQHYTLHTPLPSLSSSVNGRSPPCIGIGIGIYK